MRWRDISTAPYLNAARGETYGKMMTITCPVETADVISARVVYLHQQSDVPCWGIPQVDTAA